MQLIIQIKILKSTFDDKCNIRFNSADYLAPVAVYVSLHTAQKTEQKAK
jgi:hypothetical protein